jgi:hypothetical protein
MYELFIKNNIPKDKQVFENKSLTENLGDDIKMLFEECGGYSFRNGLYRVHNPNSSLHWAILISNYFTKYKKIIPFGYDWMGRQFAIDRNKENCILMFDPATAEDFELNQNLISFHNHDLVDERESFLAEQLFNQVIISLGINEINYDECAGYKVPLFLNGSDALDNYEISNMEVYWEMQCQIYLQIKDLPPGTKINSIKFKQ